MTNQEHMLNAEEMIAQVADVSDVQSEPSVLPVAPVAIQSQLREQCNRIELVGVIVEQRNRDRAVVGVTRSTMFRTRFTRLLVEITEEDGALHTMTLNVPLRADQPEREALLQTLVPGDRIRARGRIHTEQTYDTRFATHADPDGRPSRQLAVTVETLDRATEDDLDGSWLQLTGRISVPPTIRYHEVAVDDEIGRTHIVVEWVEPSQRPGSRAQVSRTDRIPLDVPLLLETSQNALRAGNLVTIEGRLEPFRRQIRPEDDRYAQDFLEAWEQQRQVTYATLSERERKEQERRDENRLRGLRYEKDVRVRAGYVELHVGAPMSVNEARRTRRTYAKKQKRRDGGNSTQNGAQRPLGVAQHTPTNGAALPDNEGVRDHHDRPTRHRRQYACENEHREAAPSIGASAGAREIHELEAIVEGPRDEEHRE
jgi:hypothetical protein